jgi:signal transduction histidine kinase
MMGLISSDALAPAVRRLTATIELGRLLVRETDPARLVETVCRGVQNIIGASYAVCGLAGPSGAPAGYLYASGLPADTADLLRQAARRGDLFEWMLRQRVPDRRRLVKGDIRRVGLPDGHPRIETFLGVPVQHAQGAPGWIYLADKFGRQPFTDEDEQLVSTIACQAGIAVHNAHLREATARQCKRLKSRNTALAAALAERKRVETARLRLEAQLLHAQKMAGLGTLAGGMAHDINNCLVPIMSLTDLVMESLPPGSRERTCVGLIKNAGGRINDLVRRILIFSRRGEVELAPVDLAAIFADSIKLLRPTLSATIDLRSRIGCRQAIVDGNAGQLQQVLLNLCVNAADAIGQRSDGVIELALDAVAPTGPLDAVGGRVAPGNYYRLSAGDNGCGMDAATIDRIFEPFYTTKAPGKGTGLGLAMVRTIVQAHDGHVRVTSSPGAGTRFEIYLPCHESTAADRSGEAGLARWHSADGRPPAANRDRTPAAAGAATQRDGSSDAE